MQLGAQWGWNQEEVVVLVLLSSPHQKMSKITRKQSINTKRMKNSQCQSPKSFLAYQLKESVLVGEYLAKQQEEGEW